MTAEVGLMNRNGVALAADSAVTIGRDARKIYTSAEKLFQLSETTPVAVMVYGSAALVSVPWETIIKSYRAEFGNEERDSVDAYANHFLSYLRNSRKFFPAKIQDTNLESIVDGFFLGLREIIRKEIDSEAEKRDGLTEKNIPPLLAKVVTKHSQIIKSHKLIKDIPPKTRDVFKRRFRNRVDAIKKVVFEKLPFTANTSRLVTNTAFELLFRECFGNRLTGLVFAGYGIDEVMPSLVHFHMEEMVSNRLR